MSKDDVQQEVRARDRFLCPNCGERRGEQYAHIVPDSDGSPYIAENILFLCGECHNNLEPAKAKPEQKRRLIELAQRLKDAPRKDGVLTSTLTFVSGPYPTITLGGGMTIRNSVSVLEKQDDPSNPYLKLETDDLGRLAISARFEDVDGIVVMEIIKNKITLHTKDAWDIVLKRRSLSFEDAKRSISLRISQSEDLSLLVTGSLYLNGGLYVIDAEQIAGPHGMIIRNSSSQFNGYGVLLSPNQLII